MRHIDFYFRNSRQCYKNWTATHSHHQASKNESVFTVSIKAIAGNRHESFKYHGTTNVGGTAYAIHDLNNHQVPIAKLSKNLLMVTNGTDVIMDESSKSVLFDDLDKLLEIPKINISFALNCLLEIHTHPKPSTPSPIEQMRSGHCEQIEEYITN